MYLPMDGNGLKCFVGQEASEKNEAIKKEVWWLKEVVIIEGSHIGNRKELEIFTRELQINCPIFIFKVVRRNKDLVNKWRDEKYGVTNSKAWKNSNKWFKTIYNLKEDAIIESAEDIINYINKKHVSIRLSG